MSNVIPDIPGGELSQEPEANPINWVEILSFLWSSRKLIGFATGVATVGAIIVSLLLPEYFRSTATLLPETEKSKLASLGGLSDLAALAGVNVGGNGSFAKLYPTIVKGEAVLRNVIYAQYQTEEFPIPVDLIKYWEIEEATPERDYETALKVLREGLEVSSDNKTNVVTIAIETPEPALSAAIVNNVTNELDAFIRTKQTTNAGEQRRWIEDRLEQVTKDLGRSEDVLKEFREKNRRVGDSPQLLLEQGRLLREVEINSTLYTELKKQFEIAKIEEIKNIPIINIMDPGRPAGRKSNPKRSMIVAVVFFVSFLSSSAYVLGIAKYGAKLNELRDHVFVASQNISAADERIDSREDSA